jgi:SAM-dependent methyltransferase
MSDERKAASAFRFLRGTIFHPQWLALRVEPGVQKTLGALASGNVLDVGCSDQRIKAHLAQCVDYTGLDYYTTAIKWYGTSPDVFGDAHHLPFRADQFQSVLLLDVLEHLESPQQCLEEIFRVLRPGGRFFLKVPCLYPIHDAPRDFTRWTTHGLQSITQRAGFQCEIVQAHGHPLETSVMLLNIALSKTVLNLARRRNPLALAGMILPVLFAFSNLVARLVAGLSSEEPMMPFGYLLVLNKPATGNLVTG